jgi:hypothetical protein
MELSEFRSCPTTKAALALSGSEATRFSSLWYLEKRTMQRTHGEAQTMEEQRPVQGQVQIKADEKELQGEYSNLVMIHHNLEEFTLNFIYIFPNGQQGKLLKSMIVNPGHAKRIFRALGENIARYEAQFGTIKEMPEGGPTPNVGFVQ